MSLGLSPEILFDSFPYSILFYLFLFVIAPGWEEPSGDAIDKNCFLTPLLHQVPAKSDFSSCACFLDILTHTIGWKGEMGISWLQDRIF